jgi:hypothetical protein
MSSQSQLPIKQGTVGRIADCRIGLKAVESRPPSPDLSAAIAIVTPQLHSNKSFVSQDVRKADLVLVCGGFLRVLEVGSGDGGTLLLGRQPVAVIAGAPETSPRFDVMTITTGAIARLVSPTGVPITPFASAELLGHRGSVAADRA